MIVIKCPHCDYEYLPGEIFVPKYFLGQPTDIQRDIYGKIISFDGVDQNLEEDFQCSKCLRNFKVKANISYDIITEKKFVFDEEYITKKDRKLILSE